MGGERLSGSGSVPEWGPGGSVPEWGLGGSVPECEGGLHATPEWGPGETISGTSRPGRVKSMLSALPLTRVVGLLIDDWSVRCQHWLYCNEYTDTLLIPDCGVVG